MITRKIGPALAAGCTVVAKSPGETPFTAAALAELAHRAGIPAGVVNVITALDNTAEVGETLTSSSVVRKVSFTGSTRVGQLLMKQSAATLKKLSFELGGNAPFIVFDDADVDAAVAGAIACKFRSSGQTCVCANRIFVQNGIYDDFAAKFADKVRGFTVGYGYDEGVTHGPLIHDRAVGKVVEHVEDAKRQGAKVVVGGQKMPELGANFFQPTVLTGMKPGMKLHGEETFGPVAGLFPFDTEAEVVEMANRAEVGLAGYFFSRDLKRVYRVAEALEVGMCAVNTGILSDPATPFGGVKMSGFGREGSMYGVDEYVLPSLALPTSSLYHSAPAGSRAARYDADLVPQVSGMQDCHPGWHVGAPPGLVRRRGLCPCALLLHDESRSWPVQFSELMMPIPLTSHSYYLLNPINDDGRMSSFSVCRFRHKCISLASDA